MSIGSKYKEQTDLFCEAAYKVGSEEMLEMAKTNSGKRTGAAKKLRFAGKAVLIPVAAVLFGISATVAAGAAGYGPLSGLFTKYFDDNATQKLADEGYIYTAENYAEDTVSDDSEKRYPVMGETLEKDIFSARVMGLAGDTQNPMMLIDITVNDPAVVEASDIIGVYTLALGTEEFETRMEDFGLSYGKGVRDENDPSLYHVSTRVPPLWVTNGEEVVVDIVSIHTLGDNDGRWELGEYELARMFSGSNNISSTDFYDKEIEDMGLSPTELTSKVKVHCVDMQFRFTIPENVLKEAAEVWYDELEFEVNGTLYRLNRGEFGAHETHFSLDYDMEDFDYPARDKADKEAAAQFVLTVDGVSITPDVTKTWAFKDEVGNVNLGIKDMCYMPLSFPAFDYENAQSIILSANGVSYEVKPVSDAG